MKPVLAIQLEGDAERVRQNHADAIKELQSVPFASARIIQNVVLQDGIATSIAHGLKRLPQVVLPSPPRGTSATGSIEEVRGSQNRELYVVLKANGYGTSVTIDLVVA